MAESSIVPRPLLANIEKLGVAWYGTIVLITYALATESSAVSNVGATDEVWVWVVL